MEEAPENGKESPHSVHANGLIDWVITCDSRVAEHVELTTVTSFQ